MEINKQLSERFLQLYNELIVGIAAGDESYDDIWYEAILPYPNLVTDERYMGKDSINLVAEWVEYAVKVMSKGEKVFLISGEDGEYFLLNGKDEDDAIEQVKVKVETQLKEYEAEIEENKRLIKEMEEESEDISTDDDLKNKFKKLIKE